MSPRNHYTKVSHDRPKCNQIDTPKELRAFLICINSRIAIWATLRFRKFLSRGSLQIFIEWIAVMVSEIHKRNRRMFAVARSLSLAFAMALPTIGFPHIAALAASPAAPSKAPALNQELREPAGDWCAQYRLNQLSAKARLSEPNRTRLLAAQRVLAPSFRPGKANDGVLLLADYQSEMEGVRPDRVLAATYLAVASAVPIDLKLVERVNSVLCVSASAAVAKGVALIANAEWREMNSAK